jgi:site-specific DNA-methyltransferase (adenine-specific)
MTILAYEHDVFDFLSRTEGLDIDGCLTDFPYPTLERHRRVGTTTRLKESSASSNPWFKTLSIEALCDVLAGIFRSLRKGSYAFVYVDSDTQMLLQHALGVAEALLPLLDKATSRAPVDKIGFAWWAPATWGKVDKHGAPSGGMGFHGARCTEQILILEKPPAAGKSSKLRRFNNLFLQRRPAKRPENATIDAATPKPISIAATLAWAMGADATQETITLMDPFVGCGNHAVGFSQAGADAVVNDAALDLCRDHLAARGYSWLEG